MENMDVDKMYITTNSRTKGAREVSEVYTLFNHNIDAQYFQGVKNESNGETYLPYSQRYIYSDLNEKSVKENEKAAYLITTDEKIYFDDNKYNFTPYQGVHINYLVVTEK